MGMGYLSKFLPHERIVVETEEEINDALSKRDEENEKITYEYKDESKRSFWDFFDEFEYRKNKPSKFKYIFTQRRSPIERKLLLKLDIMITFYSFLGYWVKFLDSANLNNAYVSGMKEDIGMKLNDLVDTQIMYYVGAIIFTLPFAYVLPRYPAPYVLLIGEFIWSLFTLVTYATPDVKALKAFRFFVGAAETTYFPIIHYAFANWFKPHEITKRAGFFYIGQYLGILTSGMIQGAVYDLLNGVNGLSGWRWAFIIDSLISFAVCFIGFFAIPGTPFKCYSLFLTDEEIKFARKRMRENGTNDGLELTNFFDKKTWKKIFTSWPFYIFSIANVGGFNSSNSPSGSFALWLQSLNRYSIPKLNKLTAIPPAMGIAWLIITTTGADLTRKRFIMIIFAQLMNFIGNIILAVWDVSEKAKWFSFYFSYWAWCQSSVFYPLQNDILRHDSNRRSIEWVLSYTIGLQSTPWISKIVWQTVDAPRYPKGFLTAGLMGIAQAVTLIVGYFFYKRDERRNAKLNGVILYNSAKGELPQIDEISEEEEISKEKTKKIIEVVDDEYDSKKGLSDSS